MFRDEKNLKDIDSSNSSSLKDNHVLISYSKTNKLITAMYMVTDIMDTSEPIRNKLRTLGLEIISDIHEARISKIGARVHEILSLLDIASTLNLISEMNIGILRNEFLELNKSVSTYLGNTNKSITLEELFKDEINLDSPLSSGVPQNYKKDLIGHGQLKERTEPTRIGVQKGSTLMQALSDKTMSMSSKNSVSFELLKKTRRDDIISIIKGNTEGLTIKDITNIIKDKQLPSLVSSGEKTIQRELMAMVKDGVLNKKGEKRWSRYFI